MKQVKHYMKRKVIGVFPETPLQEVWGLIFKKGVHGLPVMDKESRLLGIISEEDLLAKIYPEYSELLEDLNHFNLSSLEKDVVKLKKLKAKDVMNRIVFTTDPEASIFKALSRMLMLQVRQLPVLDNKKRVIGIISKGDIFDQILRDYLQTGA